MSLTLIRRNANYRRLVGASGVSNLGDGVSALAFPWLATLITRDPVLVSLTVAAGRLPWMLLSLPAGVWTDRVDRRRLMIRADLFRIIVTLGVVAMVLTAPPPVASPAAAIGALCAVAFLLGSAEVLRDNAAQTVLPSVVRADDLEVANGQMWSVERIMGEFVGPPLAGVLIAASLPAPFVFDAMTFALAAGLVWMMVIPAGPAPARRSFRVELTEGLSWIWRHVMIWRLAIVLGLINACAVAALTMLVLFSREVLGLGAVGHGLLLTCGAAGGVIGGILAPTVARRIGGTRSLRAAFVLFVGCYAVVGAATSPGAVGAAIFVESLGAMLWNVVTVSYRQRSIPDALLGRVNAVYRFFGWGMMPLGALAGGLLVTWAEPWAGRETALRLPYWCAAGLLAITGLIGVMTLRLPDEPTKK